MQYSMKYYSILHTRQYLVNIMNINYNNIIPLVNKKNPVLL